MMGKQDNERAWAASDAAPSSHNDSDTGSAPNEGIDPTLVDDLGAEYEFRGDVLEDEKEVTEDLLEKTQAVAEEYRDRFVRLQAEWDNFRKRLAVEREQERIRANEKLVESLLPVLDDMERALSHAREGVDEGISVSSFADGIEAVHSKLINALEGVSVEVIDPTNQPFDANLHNAVQKIENPELHDETVVATIQKGYVMGDYVLRPAMVVVSTGGPKLEKG